MEEKIFEIPKMKINMVQEGTIYSNIEKIANTEDIAEFVASEIGGADREIVGVINVNINGKILNWNTVSIGNLTSASCDVRDVFKSCILSNASGMFTFHCHPSGDATPSELDIETTEKLVKAGQLLGIPVIDSIIIGCGTHEFCSLRGENPDLFGDNPEESKTEIILR